MNRPIALQSVGRLDWPVKLMPSKKIILFIVEGVTDQTCLGSVLSRLLDSYEIRFELIRTDITIANGADTGNIVSRIGDAVKHFCGKIYKRSDIYEVIHLIDTDGAYISEEKVIYDNITKPFYEQDNISTNNVTGIIARNSRKASVLNRLISLSRVWRDIPYRVYFFSCNLDHVFHDNPNLSKEEKTDLANRFEDKFADNPERFMAFLNDPQYAVNGDYNQTWDFIKLNSNSLRRYTNFYLYFNNSDQ
jgi:hypothetical protein